jgi:Kef-type K+ transport system membrane component KefB
MDLWTVAGATSGLFAAAEGVSTSVELATQATALRKMHVEDVLLPVMIQIGIILLVARMASLLFRRFGQSGVVGEIAAGLFLGPSVFGRLFPDHWGMVFHPQPHDPAVAAALFDATLHWVFTILSQIGLMLLLFLVGLEFEFRHLKQHARSAFSISLAGLLLPFGLGSLLALWMYPRLVDAANPSSGPPFLGFVLFLGTAMSITALPILGRLMMELNLTRTRVGAITITAAAMDDAAGWILLAAVTSVVRGNFEVWQTLKMLGQTLLFAGGMLLVARPLLVRWARTVVKDGELTLNGLAATLVLVLACGLVTNLIGIFAIFGAFLLGAVMSTEEGFREAVNKRLRDFVTVFFLPIFFTYTGLRTDVQSLATPELWLMCGLVLAAAIVGKFVGCGVAARLSGFPPREAACIGAMMNTRALMELIVINVGYQLGVIPHSVFCMLVIMALVTTVMTTPILLRLARGTSLWPDIERSIFVQGEATLLVAPAAPRAGGPEPIQ